MGIGQFNSEKINANENYFFGAHTTTISEWFLYLFFIRYHHHLPTRYLLVILGHSGNRSLPRTGLLYTESTRGKEERKRVCACVWRPTHRRCTLYYRNSSSNNSLQASRLLFCVLCSVARNIYFESGKLLLSTQELWVRSVTSGNTGPLLTPPSASVFNAVANGECGGLSSVAILRPPRDVSEQNISRRRKAKSLRFSRYHFEAEVAAVVIVTNQIFVGGRFWFKWPRWLHSEGRPSFAYCGQPRSLGPVSSSK